MVMDTSEAAKDEDEIVSITLLERGSHWPEGLDTVPPATFENVVLAQCADESTDAFVSRASRRLLDIRASGHQLKAATVLVGAGSDKGSPIVHSRLAMLVGRFLPKEGRLTLVGDDNLSAAERADLASIAATLSEHFGPEGPGIRLHLELRHERAPKVVN